MAKKPFDVAMILNDKSNAQRKPPMRVSRRVESIPLDVIDPAPGNEYSMDGIEELAASIETVGLLQMPLVRPKGERYEVIAGHRRREACLLLGWERMDCEVIPSNDDIMTELRLIVANATARVLTDADKVFQTERLGELLQALKKSGQKLGMRMREAIANIMHTSLGQVARYQHISTHLSADWRRVFNEGGIRISTAYEIATRDTAAQADMMRAYNETGEIVFPQIDAETELFIENREDVAQPAIPSYMTDRDYTPAPIQPEAPREVEEPAAARIEPTVHKAPEREQAADIIADGMRHGVASGAQDAEKERPQSARTRYIESHTQRDCKAGEGKCGNAENLATFLRNGNVEGCAGCCNYCRNKETCEKVCDRQSNTGGAASGAHVAAKNTITMRVPMYDFEKIKDGIIIVFKDKNYGTKEEKKCRVSLL